MRALGVSLALVVMVFAAGCASMLPKSEGLHRVPQRPVEVREVRPIFPDVVYQPRSGKCCRSGKVSRGH